MPISVLVVTAHSDLPETHLLIGLFKAGIDMTVMCPLSAPHRAVLEGVGIPLITIDLQSRVDQNGIRSIKNLLASKRIDIIHAFNNRAVSNALIASKRFPCKFIAYRGIEGNVSYYDPMSWMTYLHPRVDVIVCVADAIRRYFWNMKLFGLKWPVKKAITIYKGHDPGWYQKTIPLREFAIPDTAFVVGCTVNDRPRKGLIYLIEAIRLLPPRLPFHFVLIGNINNKEVLNKIRFSPYAENIHLLGFQKDAAAIIRNCDVCVLPAYKREGLPKAVIEGMIQGVAPIVTDSGGSPELIEGGESGLVVAPRSATALKDAMVRLYDNNDLLNKIQKAARERIVNHFFVENTIKRHMTLYERLVDGD